MKHINHIPLLKMSKKKKAALLTATAVIAFGGFFLFLAAIWGMNNVANIDLNQVIYYFSGNAEGTDSNLIQKFLLEAFLPAVLLTICYVVLFFIVGTHTFHFRNKGKIKCVLSRCFPVPKTRQIAFVLSIALLAGSVTYSAVIYDVEGFFSDAAEQSSFIEKNYTDPETTQIVFPDNKKNLIYIYMESTENTYFSEENGGLFNVMPELEQLALDNLNFSNGDGLGGAKQYDSTDWTVAAMVSQTAGIPLKSSLNKNNYGQGQEFLSGAYSLGQVLEAEGYKNYLLIGSDKSFANRDKYFEQHGNYSIYDLNNAIEDGVVEKGNGFWGFEDSVLFELAKKQLTELADDPSVPFNYTVLTVDTHYPYGWECEDCLDNEADTTADNREGNEKYKKYKQAMSCSSKKVVEFVEGIQQQSFYENTTIIISGDHLSMSKQVDNEAKENNYERTTVNIFINAAAEPKITKNRDFGTFDIYPTTLAALGCRIEGDRLGLGTNLFSDVPTLAETYGYEVLNEELKKQSAFYAQDISGSSGYTTE